MEMEKRNIAKHRYQWCDNENTLFHEPIPQVFFQKDNYYQKFPLLTKLSSLNTNSQLPTTTLTRGRRSKPQTKNQSNMYSAFYV
jgi:hypothetical protein